MFWRHLSDANLIDGSFGTGASVQPGYIDAQDAPATGATGIAQVNAYIPAAKIGKATSITVLDYNPANYFIISAVSAIQNDGLSYTTTGKVLAGGLEPFATAIDRCTILSNYTLNAVARTGKSMPGCFPF